MPVDRLTATDCNTDRSCQDFKSGIICTYHQFPPQLAVYVHNLEGEGGGQKSVVNGIFHSLFEPTHPILMKNFINFFSNPPQMTNEVRHIARYLRYPSLKSCMYWNLKKGLNSFKDQNKLGLNWAKLILNWDWLHFNEVH